jgi:hypothetical protein
MKKLFIYSLVAFISISSFANDKSKEIILKVGEKISKVAGQGNSFDIGAALQACDGIAREIEESKEKPKKMKGTWEQNAKKKLPCSSDTSMELMGNLTDDPSLKDEPVFNTCIRMVKIMRKSGDCGNAVPTPQEKLAIPAISN